MADDLNKLWEEAESLDELDDNSYEDESLKEDWNTSPSMDEIEFDLDGNVLGPDKEQLGVLGAAWQGVKKGASGFVEGVGGLGEAMGIENEFDDAAREYRKDLDEKYETGPVGKVVETITEGATQFLPMLVPGVGTTGLIGTLAGKNLGQSYSQYKDQGASDARAFGGALGSSVINTGLDIASMYPATLSLKYGKRIALSAGADVGAALASVPVDYFLERDVAKVDPFQGQSVFDVAKQRAGAALVMGTAMPTVIDGVRLGTGKAVDFTTKAKSRKRSAQIEQELKPKFDEIVEQQSSQDFDIPRVVEPSTAMQLELEAGSGAVPKPDPITKFQSEIEPNKDVSTVLDNLGVSGSKDNLMGLDGPNKKGVLASLTEAVKTDSGVKAIEATVKENKSLSSTINRYLKFVTSPRTWAERFPLFRDFHDPMLDIDRVTHLNIADLSDRAQAYFKLRDTSKVDSVLALARETRKTGKRFIPTEDALKQLGLNKQEVSAFQGVRKALDMALDMRKDSLISAEIKKMNIPELKGMKGTPQEIANALDISGGAIMKEAGLKAEGLTAEERLFDINNQIAQTRKIKKDNPNDNYLDARLDLLESAKAYTQAAERIQKVESVMEAKRDSNYVPFGREGDFPLRVVEEDGSTAALYWADDKKERRQLISKLLEQGVNEKLIVPEPKIEKTSSLLYEDLPTSMKLNIDDIDNLGKQGLPVQGFDQHMIDAYLVPGYSKNFRSQIAKYINGISHVAAKEKILPDAEAAFKRIEQAYDNNGNPRAELKDMYEEAKKFKDYIQNPPKEATLFKKHMAFMNLGLNIRPLAMNLTQSISTTYPKIVGLYEGRVKAPATKAAKVNIKAHKQAVEYLSNPKAFKKKHPKLFDELELARRDGTVGDQSLKELFAAGEKPGMSTDYDNLVNTSMTFFSGAETYNRTQSFIAAYEAGKDLKLSSDLGKFARETTRFDTQFDYSRFNRPPIARGYIGGAVTTFRQFGFQYMRMLRQMLGQKQYKAFATSLAGQLALGGVRALPMASWVMASVEAAGYDPEMSAKKMLEESSLDELIQGIAKISPSDAKKLEKKIGDVAWRGLPTLGGVDVSGAIAAGEQAPFAGKGLRAGVEQFVLGATDQELQRFEKFTTTMSRSSLPLPARTRRAVTEALVPDFLKRKMRSDIVSERDGLFTNRYGDRLPDPRNPSENLVLSPYQQKVMAAGFTPSILSEAYAKQQSAYKIREDGTPPNFNKRLAEALLLDREQGKDSYHYDRALEALDEWNEKHPSNRYKADRSRIKNYQKQMQSAYLKEISKTRKQLRDEVKDVFDFNTDEELKGSAIKY